MVSGRLKSVLCLLLFGVSSCTPKIFPEVISTNLSSQTPTPAPTPTPTPVACQHGKTTYQAVGDWEFGGLEETFSVPAGCTSIEVKMWGAGGGGSGYGDLANFGGAGGFVSSALAVTPGEALRVRVGHGGMSAGYQYIICQNHSSFCNSVVQNYPFETYGGGGKGAFGTGGNGGGSSSVLRGAVDLLVAGGGGGVGNYSGQIGGAGGGDTAEDGHPLALDLSYGGQGGKGGSLSTLGGAGGGSSQAGSRGIGGNGGDQFFSEGDPYAGGGGGGGGYWGGGGGAGSRTGFNYGSGGGGGGCSYVSGIALANERGSGRIPPQVTDPDYLPYIGTGGWDGHPANRNANGGNGLIVITW